MDINAYLSSKSTYMNSKNAVDGSEYTILEVKQESGIGLDKDDALVCYWQEPEVKPLILNKTNAMALSNLFGGETDTWKGCRVGISVQDAMFRGAPIKAVRLLEAAKTTTSKIPF